MQCHESVAVPSLQCCLHSDSDLGTQTLFLVYLKAALAYRKPLLQGTPLSMNIQVAKQGCAT